MLTLLSEVHFWTTQDDIQIKDTDFGVFKYSERRDDNVLSNNNVQTKRIYTEKRNYLCHLTNKRPSKLKDKLKEFEELLAQNKVVYYKWTENILEIMLNIGIFIYVFVNVNTGDVEKISFDKFLIGKLQTTCISDVLKTRSHLLCTYNDNRIMLIHFTKKSTILTTGVPQKLSRLEPRLQICEIAGPSGRRIERKMSCNATSDRLLVWWKSSTDEVYPWSPLVKDQDRANVHIYSLYGSKLELQCYRRTEFDPLEIIFDNRQLNLIHCVEQKISRRGTVSVEVATFEIVRNKLQRNHVTSIPLQTHVSCHAFSSDEVNKLAIGCIDGSIVVFDRQRGITNLVKAAFIPTFCSWHPSGAVLLIANERSQMQFFDLALACIKSQTIAEDIIPSNILDLTSYFKHQPTLSQHFWNNKYNNINNSIYDDTSIGDSLLVLIFERGPLVVVRLLDYGGAVLYPDNLIFQYIQNGNIERALNILLTLDWNTNSEQCLASLQNIINYLFRIKFTPNVESQIQKALGSFYAPLRPISNTTKSDFGDQIADLTRKFFHTLIRHQLYEKAFCLAIDIGDHDLFMDLYHVARKINDQEMSSAALTRANELLDQENSDTEHTESVCSRTSCSECSDSDSEKNSLNQREVSSQRKRCIDSWTNDISPEDETKNIPCVPPLPNITSNNIICETSVLPPLPTINLNYSNSRFLGAIAKKPFITTVSTSNIQNVPTINNSTNSFTIDRMPTTKNSLFINEQQSPQNRNENKIFKSKFTSPILSMNGSYNRVFQSSLTGGYNYFNNNINCFPLFSKANTFSISSCTTTTNNNTTTTTTTSTTGSSNNILTIDTSTSISSSSSSSYNSNSPTIIVHKTVSLNIPPVSNFISTNSTPSVSAYQPSKKLIVPLNISASATASSSSSSVKSNSEKSEKNVKFSDTVTAFIVPELPRSEKSKRSINMMMMMNQTSNNPFLTNPKQELQDSLPLCHPEDEYLKDFTPIANRTENLDNNDNTTSTTATINTTTTTTNTNTTTNTTKIKVVHFGMV